MWSAFQPLGIAAAWWNVCDRDDAKFECQSSVDNWLYHQPQRARNYQKWPLFHENMMLDNGPTKCPLNDPDQLKFPREAFPRQFREAPLWLKLQQLLMLLYETRAGRSYCWWLLLVFRYFLSLVRVYLDPLLWPLNLQFRAIRNVAPAIFRS